MKKLLLLLLVLIPFGLFAQDRYITILAKDAPALKQYKINWHTGIDPIQIKDGSWILPEKVIPLIPSGIKILDATEKIVTNDLREYLISKPVTVLLNIAFKEAEIIVEPKVIELIK